MLSVLKHTKTPLKFWFLKNYLSPTFKVCYLLEIYSEKQKKKIKAQTKQNITNTTQTCASYYFVHVCTVACLYTFFFDKAPSLYKLVVLPRKL